nr:PREDICTED: uncharacterized protein LOC103281622 [Anolis carolinensis]XP_008121766.1 PREDICTED: uncharacterized protein LOC103281622 [Anolis carolinensis]XP_008121767.1 PREDICTED: uncharacterized protein LOC103281622 [Anolis carolinensis]XP_016854158.1 PREDICTED: uncharacterized protein LOC103281622 [Anolis carolinensis]|eukprot:XP_008121765.1 PREDICTED: uncharacterized protein LOC103281622 [Anolis carolinensis]
MAHRLDTAPWVLLPGPPNFLRSLTRRKRQPTASLCRKDEGGRHVVAGNPLECSQSTACLPRPSSRCKGGVSVPVLMPEKKQAVGEVTPKLPRSVSPFSGQPRPDVGRSLVYGKRQARAKELQSPLDPYLSPFSGCQDEVQPRTSAGRNLVSGRRQAGNFKGVRKGCSPVLMRGKAWSGGGDKREPKELQSPLSPHLCLTSLGIRMRCSPVLMRGEAWPEGGDEQGPKQLQSPLGPVCLPSLRVRTRCSPVLMPGEAWPEGAPKPPWPRLSPFSQSQDEVQPCLDARRSLARRSTKAPLAPPVSLLPVSGQGAALS